MRLQKTMLNIPNGMTLARLVSLPFLVGLMMVDATWAAWCALILYTLGCVTDWLDGYIARRYNMMTPFGQFLDPIADKIFILTVLIALVANGRLDGIWILPVILILTREFLISGLREFLGPKNITIPVTYLAKWKTTIQMIALGFLVVGDAGNILLPHTVTIGLIGLTLATILTIITGFEYIKASWSHLS